MLPLLATLLPFYSHSSLLPKIWNKLYTRGCTISLKPDTHTEQPQTQPDHFVHIHPEKEQLQNKRWMVGRRQPITSSGQKYIVACKSLNWHLFWSQFWLFFICLTEQSIGNAKALNFKWALEQPFRILHLYKSQNTSFFTNNVMGFEGFIDMNQSICLGSIKIS